jgi:hypothetical protein
VNASVSDDNSILAERNQGKPRYAKNLNLQCFYGPSLLGSMVYGSWILMVDVVFWCGLPASSWCRREDMEVLAIM